jgi:hypothetical protein
MQPWYILVDEMVDGIVIGTQDVVIANHLRRGILDVRLLWTREPYNPNSESNTGYGKQGFFKLQHKNITSLFEEKRRLARLRAPAFHAWRALALDHLRKFTTFYDDTDWILTPELGSSTVEAPTENLLTYARMSETSIEETYDYLTLLTQEHTQIRVVIRALAEKHSRAINACVDEAEIASAVARMNKDFAGRKDL